MAPSRRIGYDLEWELVQDAVLDPSDEDVLLAASSRRLFRRWTAAGHGEWMVSRDAFDVIEIADLVGSLCVYDRDEGRDDYYCRVFGEVVAGDVGFDLTGRYLSDGPERMRDLARSQYDRALASRRPLTATYRVIRFEKAEIHPREDARFVHEKLILPVTRSGRTIDCFITHIARLPADATAGLPTRGGARSRGTIE